jgi:hypothetical protein
MRVKKTLRITRRLIVAAAILIGASDTAAQTPPVSDGDWQHGTTLAGFVGAASPFSGVDPALGLSLGWELAPAVGLEGRGTWLSAPNGTSAFAAAFGARFAFESARPILPFASAGVGFYRATFDAAASGAMPRFYRQRITQPGRLSETFDDFLVTIGTGTEVFVSRHIAVRPELTVLLVTTRSDAMAVPLFGVHLVYHFESHEITP